MEYEVTQIISYLVTAETPDEAQEKWDNSNIKVDVVAQSDGEVVLFDERVEVNG